MTKPTFKNWLLAQFDRPDLMGYISRQMHADLDLPARSNFCSLPNHIKAQGASKFLIDALNHAYSEWKRGDDSPVLRCLCCGDPLEPAAAPLTITKWVN